MIIEVKERARNGAVRTTETRAAIASGLQLWSSAPGQEQWPTEIELDHRFHEHLCENAVTLDKAAIAQLSGNSLGLDIYATLAHWLPRLEKPMAMGWQQLVDAFGSDNEATNNFGRRLRRVLPEVCGVYREAKVDVGRNGIRLFPSPPPIEDTRLGWTPEVKGLPQPASNTKGVKR